MDDQYLLNRDQIGRHRLYLQHQVFAESSIRVLKESGLKTGDSLLEVACGPGYMTSVLGSLVGEQGRIDSFDISEDFVEQARKRLADWPQISIMNGDVYTFRSSIQYDFIYCRMILHHLQCPDEAVKKLLRYLKSGGILVCEEPPTFEGAYAEPLSKALALLNGLAVALFRRHQRCYEVAYHLPQLLKEANLTIMYQSVYQPILSKDKRDLIIMGLEEIGHTLVDNKLLDDKELSSLCIELRQEIQDASVVAGSRMFQIIACKAR